jgi:hypothetical protein
MILTKAGRHWQVSDLLSFGIERVQSNTSRDLLWYLEKIDTNTAVHSNRPEVMLDGGT